MVLTNGSSNEKRTPDDASTVAPSGRETNRDREKEVAKLDETAPEYGRLPRRVCVPAMVLRVPFCPDDREIYARSNEYDGHYLLNRIRAMWLWFDRLAGARFRAMVQAAGR